MRGIVVGIPNKTVDSAQGAGGLRPRKPIRFADRLAPLRMTGVRILASLMCAMFCGVLASGTTYYVSSSTGRDSNSGTSAGTAWQTIAKVNGQTFQAGDSILFQRGDVWNESLVPPSPGTAGNPIVFDAYGTGAPPNLTGYYAVPSTAWMNLGNNVWKAPVPSTYTTINFCLFGSVWGQKVGAVTTNLTDKWDFYFANGYVYVFATSNPATFYGAAIVPMALSNVPVINVNGKSWLTFQHLLVNWFDQYGVYVQGASDHLVFANMEADSMIPQGTQPLGFYVNESVQPLDIKFYNDESHLNYEGFRIDGFTFNGVGTPITLVNDKAYGNRDGALVDNTGRVGGGSDPGGPGAVTYSYCHFYASSLAVANSTDVEWPLYTLGPTAGVGNVAMDTAPAVQAWQRYPAQVTLTVDDVGMTPGADAYYVNPVLSIADAAGVPIGVAITVGYASTITPIVSEIQGWINAGRDVTSHSMSHTYYTNIDALDVQYTGAGSAATLSIANKTLTINVTGAPADSVSYDLTRGQAQGTMQGLEQALTATGHFTATENPTCQGPYGTGCSAYTKAALLTQDLADVSSQDVKSNVYHMQLDVTRLTTDEITLSRQWMTLNLTGLPATPVYVYPGGYETPAMQGITAGVPYGGARGALKEDLGVKDTYASGFDVQNVTSFGVNPSWMGLQPTALNQKIQALVWKQMVWGVPWGIFWHFNASTGTGELSAAEVTNLIADLQASGATIQTNTGLVNWLTSGTLEAGTDGNFYYKLPASSMTLDFRPTASSPVVDAGQNLGAAYQIDINGINQNSYGSGWEIGAHAFAGYSIYGGQTGSYFTIGGSGTAAPNYTARTDTSIVQPPITPPNMGGLMGAGNCQWPGDFGAPVCRITDAGFDSSKPNFTLETTTSGSGDTVLWNKDSTLLTVQNEGSRLYPVAFDPITMKASRLYATNSSWASTGGFYLAGGATSWSYSNPMVLYTLSGTKLQSYDFTGYNSGGNPPSATTVYDFTSSANCLGTGYTSTWNSFGEGSKFPADQVFVAGMSNAGAQGTGGDVVAYRVGSGCSHLNTLTGVVAGDWGATGTVGVPDRFYVHNVKISKDGQWAMVAQAGCSVSPTITSIALNSNVVTAVLSSVNGLSVGMYIDVTGVTPSSFNVNYVPLTSVNGGTNTVTWAQTAANATGSGGKIDNCASQLPYFWQIGTTNLYYSCTQGGGCGGHWTEGASHLVNGNYSPFWQEDIRPYGNNNAGTGVIPGLPLSGCSDVQTDIHQGWANVDAGDTYPFFASTAAVNANAQVSGSYNCAWVNEVLGTSPVNGTVYRFAHTETTGLNWNFDSQYSIGGGSQDGRFFAFTSDWQGTLGTEGGASGTCTNSPNSSTACRSDVFVVATKPHPNLYVLQSPTNPGSPYWSDVATYLYTSPIVAGATIDIQWADFDNGWTGTGNVTNGSASVACTSTCSSAWAGYDVVLGGTTYTIVSSTPSSLTLSANYTGSTASGVSFNVYNFAMDDGIVAAWTSAGKRVNLVLWANADSAGNTCSNYGQNNVGNCAMPSYVWTALGPSNYTTCTTQAGNQQFPNYLNAAFQADYQGGIQALVNHYGANPNIGYFRMGLGRGGETFPASGWNNSGTACGTAFQSWGVTVATWEGYLATMLQFEASLHSPKQLMVGVTPMGVPSTQVPDYVAGVAAPLGIGFGSQGLAASDVNNCSGATADWCNLFQSYEYQVPLEVQTVGQSCAPGETCSGNQASTGPLPAVLSYAAANHANIFEIYYQDWLLAYDAAYQTSVGVSAATGSSYLAALQATASGAYSQ